MKIVGHENIRNFLKQSTENNRLAHAYILNGPVHVGKTTVLEEFVSHLTKSQKQVVFEGSGFAYPDIHVLRKEEDKKNITVDQIRELKEKLSLSSFGGYKVAVIFDAHELNASSSNALLKLLEEPTPRTILFLITDRALQLLETIRSRSVTLNFHSLSDQEMKLLAKENEEKVNHQKLAEIISYSQGLPGLMLHFMQNTEEFDTIKTRVLNLVDVLGKSFADKSIYCSSIEDKKTLFSDLADVLRDLFLISSNQPERIRNRFAYDQLVKVSSKVTPQKLVSATSTLLREQEFSAYNTNKNLYFETIISQL